jgi:hypothetical protein
MSSWRTCGHDRKYGNEAACDPVPGLDLVRVIALETAGHAVAGCSGVGRASDGADVGNVFHNNDMSQAAREIVRLSAML